MRTERLPEKLVGTRRIPFSVLSSQFSVLSSQFSVLSSQFSVLSSQFSVLSSQNWMWFVFCGRYFFALVCEVIGSRFLELRKGGRSGAKWSIMRITNTPF